MLSWIILWNFRNGILSHHLRKLLVEIHQTLPNSVVVFKVPELWSPTQLGWYWCQCVRWCGHTACRCALKLESPPTAKVNWSSTRRENASGWTWPDWGSQSRDYLACLPQWPISAVFLSDVQLHPPYSLVLVTEEPLYNDFAKPRELQHLYEASSHIQIIAGCEINKACSWFPWKLQVFSSMWPRSLSNP